MAVCRARTQGFVVVGGAHTVGRSPRTHTKDARWLTRHPVPPRRPPGPARHPRAAPARTRRSKIARPAASAPAPSRGRRRSGTAPKVDVASLGRQLLGTWADTRRAAREMRRAPRRSSASTASRMAEHRERVLSQLHLLVEQRRRAPRVPEGATAARTTTAATSPGSRSSSLADPSLQIKSGVQWGLFGSAVLQLGTEEHHDKCLPGIMSLEIPGAFAMTETGHGSDVAAIGTTATYDPATEEFVIHTPFRGAWKDYLGNAALHGIAATVFAQLITNGVNHGVHCFYVPIRDDERRVPARASAARTTGSRAASTASTTAGCTSTNVRVPRDEPAQPLRRRRRGRHLLEPDREPRPPLLHDARHARAGPRLARRRRVVGVGASALHIAITYAQPAPPVRLRRAAPTRSCCSTTASTSAACCRGSRRPTRTIFAHDEFLQKFDAVFCGKADTDDDREDLETLAAALKPLSTWHALDTLQEAREACGGAGFLAENRLVGLRADLDIYVTFEGDNNVLLQLVGKRLLTDFAQAVQGHGCRARSPRYVVGQTAGQASSTAPGCASSAQTVADFGSTARSVERACATRTAARAAHRPRRSRWSPRSPARLRAGAQAAQGRGRGGCSTPTSTELIEAARAHAELLQWEAFTRCRRRDRATPAPSRCSPGCATCSASASSRSTSPGTSSTGGSRRSAPQAVTALHRPAAASGCARTRRTSSTRSATRPSTCARRIASGAEQERQDEARAHYAALRAAGTLPVPEKSKK